MEACELQHVPSRLHTDDKPTLPNFEVGENIFRRCKQQELINPFLTIDLKELSVNREGHNDPKISVPSDVLYNITGQGPEKHEKEICIMIIRDLNGPSGTYDKNFDQEKNGQTYVAQIKLLHEPVPCMYPHSVFRIWLNEVQVTEANYKDTLKKMDKIRDKLRTALGAMILQQQISQQLT